MPLLRRATPIVLLAIAGLLPAPAGASLSTAELAITPGAIGAVPTFRFALAEAAPPATRITRLTFRRAGGVIVVAPRGRERVGTVRFTAPDGAARQVALRRVRAQRGKPGRLVLADTRGLQVVLRNDPAAFLNVRPPRGSTGVDVELTTGPDALLRPERCARLTFVVRVTPVAAGLTEDRAGIVSRTDQVPSGRCAGP